MDKQKAIDIMLPLLQQVLDSQNGGRTVAANATLPLVGEGAALTSMQLVSFIADLETTLASEHDLSITLVSERALSRHRSPFRNIELLADFVVELCDESGHEAPAA